MRWFSFSLSVLLFLFNKTVEAGEFSSDFNSGVPINTHLFGNTIINPSGGVNDSAVLRLTGAEKRQQGTFIIDDLDNGAEVIGFIARFKLSIDNGLSRGADGMSFNVGPNLPENLTEAGSSNGLAISFDTFVSRGNAPPQLSVKFNGERVGSHHLQNMRTPQFVDVEVVLQTNHLINVTFDNRRIITDLEVSTFQPMAGVQFGLGARTAELMDNHLVDDLYIVTATTGKALPRRSAVNARLKKKASLKAERFFFVSEGAPLQGYYYKPEGDGPFPAVIFNQRVARLSSQESAVNPLPKLGELFTQNNYVLCLPVEPTSDEVATTTADEEKSLLEKCEVAAQHTRSALTWLQTQSFIDTNRLVLMGDGIGANSALLTASGNKEIRGTVLFSPDASQWAAHPDLQKRYVRALTEAAMPVLLLQPANISTIDAFFALRSVIEQKEKPNDSKLCQPFGQGPAAFNFANEGSDTWKGDVMPFLDAILSQDK